MRLTSKPETVFIYFWHLKTARRSCQRFSQIRHRPRRPIPFASPAAHSLGGTRKILGKADDERVSGGAPADRAIAPEAAISAKTPRLPRHMLISSENVVTTFANGL
jgi:hypothetical protein